MRILTSVPWTLRMLTAVLLVLVAHSESAAAPQLGGGQGGGLGGGQGGGNGNPGQFPGGILINPDGLVDIASVRPIPEKDLRRSLRLQKDRLPEALQKETELRFVSLRQIQLLLEDITEDDESLPPGEEDSIPDEARYLGGLTSVHYVFLMPEDDDVLLAGPAEGFARLPNGRMVGAERGLPVLCLEDLVAVMSAPAGSDIGCSFDPDPGRLSIAQAMISNTAPASSPAAAAANFERISQTLGPWNVTVFGVTPESHAGLAFIEGDFAIKLLGLGLAKPSIRNFRSYLDFARPGENMMRRWWFAPRYTSIERDEAGHVYRLEGPRLQLMSQEELVDEDGRRADAAFREVSTERYTRQVNYRIEELCRQWQSLAAVRNLFDLSLVAAIARKAEREQAIRFDTAAFCEAAAARVPDSYPAPSSVPSMVNSKMANRRLVIGVIAGGVKIQPDRLIQSVGTADASEWPAPETHVNSLWWDSDSELPTR